MLLLLLCISMAASANEVVIDRIAVIVGRTPILDSDISRDLRVTAFLNEKPPEFSAAARRKAASRLIDQELIRQQIRLGGYPMTSQAETEQTLSALKHERFGEESRFRQALLQYQISPTELRERLSWQLTALHFIDTMFRPQVTVSDPDIQTYYDAHRANFGAAPLGSVRTAIVDTITEERVNRLLDQWLAESRAATHIVYLEKSLV